MHARLDQLEVPDPICAMLGESKSRRRRHPESPFSDGDARNSSHGVCVSVILKEEETRGFFFPFFFLSLSFIYICTYTIFFSSSFPFAVVLNRKEVKRERSCFEGSVRGTLFGCQTLYGESRRFSLAVKTGRISGEPFFFLFHFQIRKCCPRLLLVTRPITRTADGGEERK